MFIKATQTLSGDQIKTKKNHQSTKQKSREKPIVYVSFLFLKEKIKRLTPTKDKNKREKWKSTAVNLLKSGLN